jgi:hypothetical protein
MGQDTLETLRELMLLLKSNDLKDRLLAIQALGEIGVEAALQALRERMVPVITLTINDPVWPMIEHTWSGVSMPEAGGSVALRTRVMSEPETDRVVATVWE